jgi:hypothetical protein
MRTLLATATALFVCIMTAVGAGVDANHPDQSDQSDNYEYRQNPDAYSKGWHDGWVWASGLSDKSQTFSDNCEKVCRRKYGAIDQDPQAEVEFYGFLAAAAYVRNHEDQIDKKSTEAVPRATPDAWGQCPGGWMTEEAIKQLLDNPGSCSFDSATEPQLTSYNGKKCWLVVVQFRTKNQAGATVTNVADVYMIGGDPTSILDARIRGE